MCDIKVASHSLDGFICHATCPSDCNYFVLGEWSKFCEHTHPRFYTGDLVCVNQIARNDELFFVEPTKKESQ